MRAFICFALLALVGACGPTAEKCSAATCTGCCDSSGQCQLAACGTSCQVCVGSEVCSAGQCVVPVVDAGVGMDAGVDAGVDAGAMDAGDPLVVTLGTRSGEFDRAQHGLQPDAGLYIEASFGGDPACPTQTSPTPDRTLIIAGLHAMPDGGVISYADGLRVTLLDFNGALTTLPFVRATSARATPLSVTPGTLAVFAIEATFDGGTLRGRFSAAHCASLDGP
jgi:hypothetical protein